ncbi:hypothetical protein TNCV_2969891 [Trichonephila clavipes]|nr:hypothetical protein TNCV_2969891 [Trichonephila clavipes]
MDVEVQQKLSQQSLRSQFFGRLSHLQLTPVDRLNIHHSLGENFFIKRLDLLATAREKVKSAKAQSPHSKRCGSFERECELKYYPHQLPILQNSEVFANSPRVALECNFKKSSYSPRRRAKIATQLTSELITASIKLRVPAGALGSWQPPGPQPLNPPLVKMTYVEIPHA